MKYDEDDDCSWPKFLLLLVLERQRKRTDASIHLPSFSSYDARRRRECPTTKSGALNKLERGGSSLKVRKRRSDIWGHFAASASSTATCKYCGESVKRTDGNTRCMKSHMNHKHPEKMSADVTQVTVDNTFLPMLKSESHRLRS